MSAASEESGFPRRTIRAFQNHPFLNFDMATNADCKQTELALDLSRFKWGWQMNNLLRLIVVSALLAFAILMIGLGMARNTNDLLAPLHLLLFGVAVVLYLSPTALAFYRGCKALLWISLVNVFTGWTIAGWFVAIGWAASGKVETLPPAPPPALPTVPGPVLQGHS